MDFEMSPVSFLFCLSLSLSHMKKDGEKKHANKRETSYMGKQWTWDGLERFQMGMYFLED